MANSPSEVKSKCRWPVLSVWLSVVVKREQRTGTKNAVLTFLFLRCLRSVMGLSWRDRVHTNSVLQATVSYTTSWPSSDIDVYNEMAMMKYNHLPKQVLYSELHNDPQPTGRPKLRFQDVAKRDLRIYRNSKCVENTRLHKNESVSLRKRKIQQIIRGGLWAPPFPSSRMTGMAMMMTNHMDNHSRIGTEVSNFGSGRISRLVSLLLQH